MQTSSLWRKEFVVIGIIVLFVGTSFLPIIRGDNGSQDESKQGRDPSTDWWPMFHHDLTHSGYSTSLAPSTSHVVWVYQTDSLILSSPAVADGNVYIGSGQTYYCLNAQTGGKIWECIIDGYAEGNPAVENGKIYLVSRSQYGVNKLFCLQADTGQYIWNYTDCYWPFNPVVYNGMVYFGSLDGYMRCLNALDGTIVWSFATNSIGVSNAPAISDGNVYFGAENGRMYCVDASNGNELWNYSTNGKIMECASISDGKVYFGSVDYEIYCLDAETGQSIWNYTTNYYVDSTPAIAYGKIFIGSRDCNLYCLDASTGEYLWSFGANDDVDSSPAVADGKVYVGSDDGNMYCLDAETGTKLWNYMTGSFVMSSPAIANGKVYIGSYDNNVYCFGGELTADFTWAPTQPSHGQTVTLNASGSYDPNGYTITSYEWDWDGDGLYDETSVTPLATHQWSDPGSYPVTLRVTNDINQTATKTKTIGVGNQPPNPPSITGPAEGKIKVALDYSFTATDPEGDTLSYFIDWGDNSTSGWLGPYQSGAAVTQSHTWTNKGIYTIKAKAKDFYGKESDWGTLSVTMPLSYESPHLRFLAWLFERFPQALPILRHLTGN
jgi:outer membrane protein assembly factor BamB